MVDKPDLGKYQPSCYLAHGLVNKLSVIVGYCDILKDDTEPDSQCEKKLRLIREIAVQIAKELNGHQCDLEVILRESAKKPETVMISTRTSKGA